MATPVVAAGAGALGFYLWLRQWQQCGYAGVRDLPLPLETHARTEAPPNTWSETMYLFKEAIRYMYQETLGRWNAVDLFFGLAYLSRRLPDEYPAADIAAAGQPLTTQDISPVEAQQLLQQLQHVRRYMLYCQGLRHHKPEQQLRHWRDMLSLGEQQIICHNPTAGLLRPAYVIVRDDDMQQIILCVRGTHSRPDMFTSLTGTVKPHHAMTADGAVLGYSHLGMLAAARWLMARTKDTLIAALQENSGYELRVVGHSMGGGTAAMLTMMFREKQPELSGAAAYAIACPACMTKQLAASCAPFVTTLVHGTDIVPTFSTGAIDALRQEVTGSSWFAEFQSDVRQRLTMNFNSSLMGLRQGAVGTAVWTQQNIIRTAAAPFNACYGRTEQACYSRMRPQSFGTSAAAAANSHAAAAGSSTNSGRNPFSRLVERLPGSKAAAVAAAESGSHAGGAAAAGQDVVHAHEYVIDASGVQTSEHTALLMRSPAWHWLYGWGSSSKRHTAAAAGDEVDSNSNGSSDVPRSARAAEAELVEKALQACLSAADSGQFGPVPGTSASGNRAGSRATPGPSSSSNGSSSSSSISGNRLFRSGRGPGAAVLAGSRQLPGSAVFKAASRAVLGKRPAAPGKKDDDSTENFVEDSTDAAGGRPPLSSSAAAAASAGSNSGALPVSTAAGDAASDDADPALVAASSTSKPKPLSLRRRGWGWGGMLGSTGAGWVTTEQHLGSSSSSGDAGRSVVQYLGDTVGNTGRLVMETVGSTSHLLKSSVIFQACAAPAVPHPVLYGGQQQQHLDRCGSTAAVQQQQNGAREPAGTALTTAPGSSNELMLMDRDDGPFVTAAAGHGSDVDGSSESDPDLLDDHDQEDGNFALNQPAMRASISALMAAVSTGEGDEVARAHREETVAAERLLRESGIGGSHANLPYMVQQQLHNIPESPPAAAAAAAAAAVDTGGSSSADEIAAGQQQQHAASGNDKAAERLARRRMYPAGRILHFLPASVVAAAQRSVAVEGGNSSRTGEQAMGFNHDVSSSSGIHSVQRQLPPLTAASGTGGLGDNYALLQVSDVSVYGRMRLCPSMVTDHFIPHYIKAVDNVIGQLMLMDSDG